MSSQSMHCGERSVNDCLQSRKTVAPCKEWEVCFICISGQLSCEKATVESVQAENTVYVVIKGMFL